jgi:3'-phosphoadenosine 5'-phosphosulfate sulfotransferase (PAPS reductase)/FAD synthetase
MTDVTASTPELDLSTFDYIVVNTSAGKDSQAMLDLIVELATTAGVADRIVAVHCDLGRVEWARNARARRRAGRRTTASASRSSRRELGDLLDQVEARGMFPSSTGPLLHQRPKDQPGQEAPHQAHRRSRRPGPPGPHPQLPRPPRPGVDRARAKKAAVLQDSATNGKRDVVRWHPILDWTVDQVWARIAAAGTRVHDAYALGMTRLSCAFCVFASRGDLLVSAKANRPLLDEYVAVELRIGHRFTMALSAAELAALADAAEPSSSPRPPQVVAGAAQLTLFA